MKMLIIVVILLAVFQNRQKIDDYINPPPDFSATHNDKVILYSTAWCEYCKKARAFLHENNIDFYEYDIEKPEEGSAQYKSLGGNGVPLLFVNKKHGAAAENLSEVNRRIL